MTRQQAIGFMIICLLAAAILRLPLLDEIPPGPHYDEAANAILAGDIGLRGERPVFIASYTGKETLYFYLAGGLAWLMGNSLFTLRLASVFIALLTIAATYWLGCELLRDRRVALLAAALLAVSFWHLLFSRLGFRAISQPLLQALMVAALLRGLRRQDWRWLSFAGLSLGLTGYTYLAARLFPVLLLVGALPLLWGRERLGRHWRQLGGVAVIALLVLSPLLHYFMTHPEAFWVRIGQVSPDGSASLWESYWLSLGMFFAGGDPYWRFNIPGQPLFSPFWAAFLLLGWLLTLYAFYRSRLDWQRAGFWLLFLAPWIMILPTALAVGEIVPSNLRAIGLLPFIYYLPAVGLFFCLRLAVDWGRRRAWWGERAMSKAAGAVIMLILFSGLLTAGHSYFNEWATRSDLYYDSDADLAEIAAFIDRLEDDGTPIYVAALHYRHPTVAFLSRQYNQLRWLPHSQAIPFPDAGPALYIFPRSSPRPDWAIPLLREATVLDGPEGPDGQPVFTAYRLDRQPELQPSHPAAANFGHAITLLGYDVGAAGAGNTLPLTLYWRVSGQPAHNVIPFVHLEDQWRYRWGQIETFAYPSEQWLPADLIVQRVDVPIRPGAPPGLYRLRVGLFDPASGQRLAHLDEEGRYAGDAFIIEPALVTAGDLPARRPQPPHPIGESALPQLELLGYERGALTAATGESLWLSLWWWATGPLPPLTSRLELLRPDNRGVILTTSQPVHNTYPFEQWPTPHFVIDHLAPAIPLDLAPGSYRLQLRLMDGADQTLLLSQLGELTVEATERLFSRPPRQFPHAAVFGEEIRLDGYDFAPQEQGYRLTLIWEALTQPTADYTVFVHLLDRDGVCCLWQQDTPPQRGGYPTGRWLPGEFVVDAYDIILPEDLPPGDYPLEIGLYLADTGQRLLIRTPNMADSDALRLREIRVER